LINVDPFYYVYIIIPTNHQVKVSADAKTIALDLVLQWVMMGYVESSFTTFHL